MTAALLIRDRFGGPFLIRCWEVKQYMDSRKEGICCPDADLSFKKRLGNTTYIIEYQFSPTARETACDKVKRLIMSEAGLNYSPERGKAHYASA